MGRVTNDRIRLLREFDERYWSRALRIAGMDEAGRGALAGPVVAACVVMPREPYIDGIDDSKKLTPQTRSRLYDGIISTALFVGTGAADVHEIERLNILGATRLAMARAAAGLECDILLIDGVDMPDIPLPRKGVPHGDAESYSIAAASIVAKVTRDRHMDALDCALPGYGFAKHKGYGTDGHYRAIINNGASREHRALFLRSMSTRFPEWDGRSAANHG